MYSLAAYVCLLLQLKHCAGQRSSNPLGPKKTQNICVIIESIISFKSSKGHTWPLLLGGTCHLHVQEHVQMKNTKQQQINIMTATLKFRWCGLVSVSFWPCKYYCYTPSHTHTHTHSVDKLHLILSAFFSWNFNEIFLKKLSSRRNLFFADVDRFRICGC
jgi:hypothetical protein